MRLLEDENKSATFKRENTSQGGRTIAHQIINSNLFDHTCSISESAFPVDIQNLLREDAANGPDESIEDP